MLFKDSKIDQGLKNAVDAIQQQRMDPYPFSYLGLGAFGCKLVLEHDGSCRSLQLAKASRESESAAIQQ